MFIVIFGPTVEIEMLSLRGTVFLRLRYSLLGLLLQQEAFDLTALIIFRWKYVFIDFIKM